MTTAELALALVFLAVAVACLIGEVCAYRRARREAERRWRETLERYRESDGQ